MSEPLRVNDPVVMCRFCALVWRHGDPVPAGECSLRAPGLPHDTDGRAIGTVAGAPDTGVWGTPLPRLMFPSWKKGALIQETIVLMREGTRTREASEEPST